MHEVKFGSKIIAYAKDGAVTVFCIRQAAFLCSLTKAVLPVSHFKERKEKNCLNCNAEVKGRYCYVCGQENTDPKQSVGHLISHFFNDVTHFDGKFFSTLGTLIRRPGRLTLEFINGRKASYLDPVRMYIFTSAIFFLVFFKTVGHIDEKFGSTDVHQNQKKIESLNDSLLLRYKLVKYDSLFNWREVVFRAKQLDSLKNMPFVGDKEDNATTVSAYNSIQQTLPSEKRDGLWKRNRQRMKLHFDDELRADPEHFTSKLLNHIIHLLPQMLFVSLPFFALILKLLYRRRKAFYYTDHVYFTIHLYTYTFISLLISFILINFDLPKRFLIIRWLDILIISGIFVYQYKAMRTFYQQRRLKTIIKFLLLNIMAVFLMILLIIVFGTLGTFTFE